MSLRVRRLILKRNADRRGEKISIGRPYIEGGKVSAEVLSHGRRDKITIIKMRRRKHYRRQAGHRQHFTEVKITEISGGS